LTISLTQFKVILILLRKQTIEENLIKIELNLMFMPEKSIHELILDSFPSSNKENWRTAAVSEINNESPEEAFAWSEKDLLFQAYYDQDDVAKLSNQNNFQLSPGNDPFLGPRAWVNMPGIKVIDEKVSNADALAQLATGADGILFDIGDCQQLNLEILLAEINWSYCSISFRTNTMSSLEENISEYIRKKKYDPAILTGTIFWDGEHDKINSSKLLLAHLTKFKSLGLMVNASNPVEEISDALIKGVNILDGLSNLAVPVSNAIQYIAFSVPTSPNFFLEIAKLKALRMLWFQVAQAYGEKKYQPFDLHLHIRSEAWTNDLYQPNANMLKSTTSALAAVLGGCNSLTIYAEENTSMMNRIARNISGVLREESYIDKVADATAGAYAIEKMTNEIAKASWLNFQQRTK